MNVCPVIASGIPVLREVAGDAALFAKTSDIDSFATTINQLVSDQTLQKELVSKGKRNLANFSLSKNAKVITDKVRSLTQK